MRILLPYCQVFCQQLVNSTSKLLAFRISFIATILAEAASFLTVYLSAELIFSHINELGSWQREEFMLFLFWVQSLLSLHLALISANFWNLSDEIRTGKLDFRLLRPLSSLFDIFTAYIRPASLCTFPLYICCFIYYGTTIGLPWLSWLVAPLLFCLSFALQVFIEIAIAMAMFWTTSGDGINFIRLNSQQVQRWPDFVYPETFRTLFTRIIPILIAGSFSCRFLLGTGTWSEVTYFIGAIVASLLVILRLWRTALLRYESASS